MTHTAQLWIYFLLVFGVILLPGMDMAYVLASALTGGRRGGLAAVAGIVCGAVFHMAAAVLGVSVLLRLYPAAFEALLLAGACYLAWIGYSILRRASVIRLHPNSVVRSPKAAFRQGMVNNLLNANAYVFTLAVIPQFLRPEYGPLWLQGTVLWGIGAACQVVVYGSVALLAAKMRSWLERDPAAGARVARAVGVMLILMAALTAVNGWHGV
ncbi:MAG TPA: LysE family translocator [Gammaproteobacteria bacterium]|jgi:threonine/homoserine/homoserine lactone efflux protein|nr:LysE family translocator [Gammaproteobacteria bacterium]